MCISERWADGGDGVESVAVVLAGMSRIWFDRLPDMKCS